MKDLFGNETSQQTQLDLLRGTDALPTMIDGKEYYQSADGGLWLPADGDGPALPRGERG